MTDEPLSFMARLKRHHIFKVASVYAIAAWVLIQLANSVFPDLGWPRQSVLILIVAVALLFPVVLALGWMLIPPSKENPDKFTRWQRLHWRLGSVVTLVIVVLATLSGAYLWHANTHHLKANTVAVSTASNPTPALGSNTSIPAKSVAVLPFENLSADKNNEYFVAGMQDLILTKLADIGDLKVISRTSTAQYASHPENIKRIGEQLGVATILEGSVQKAGDQVLINVQLIDVQTDNHIWAQAYTRTLNNVFGVEGEVAEQIATALQAKLSPVESASLAAVPTQNRAAYDLFLRAEYQANKGLVNYDTASWKAAIPLYRQAVEQDPKFALAWARLSYNESQLAWFGGGGEDVKRLNQQARADAERALQLQPDLAASQLALGYNEYWGRGDYATALKAFAAALKLKPNDADALAAQAYVERRQGHFDDAIASLQQALTLDPRNSALAFELGATYMNVSRYADAENAFQRALALDPDNRNAQVYFSGAILFSAGDIPRALTAAQGNDPALKLQRVALLTYQRKYNEAFSLLDSIPDTPDNFSYAASKARQQAGLYRSMGDMAHARALYARDLPAARAQLGVQRGINLTQVWLAIADDELGLGRTAEGLKAVGKAQAIVNKTPDQSSGPANTELNAARYAEAHRADPAVPLLVKALASPGIGLTYSPVLLWLDPAWDPIRHDPRFQALLTQYAKYKPAVTYDTAPPIASSVMPPK